MGHFGFLYDQSRCIGCNACQMACKDKNNLETGLFYRKVETLEFRQQGEMKVVHYSGACNHCEHAACVAACPTGAMHYAEDGTVLHDGSSCIGCGTCTWACPYSVPKLSHKMGIARKCDSCFDLRNEGRQPACVEACLTHCLEFVDLDLLSEKQKLEYGQPDFPFLPDCQKTKPSLRVKKRKTV